MIATVWIAKRDIFKRHAARHRRQPQRIRPISDLVVGIEDLEDPLGADAGARELADDHAQHHDWHDQQREVGVEGHQLAQAQ
jgi:hypothetical protein